MVLQVVINLNAGDIPLSNFTFYKNVYFRDNVF